MFCSKCGKEINDDAVVCINCGCPTANFQQDSKNKDTPIIINNASSSSSSAAAAVKTQGRVKRKYSLFLDIVLTLFTGGLWLIWVLIRPKYY